MPTRDSDGCGILNRIHKEYDAPKSPPVIEVHHAENSQVGSLEASWAVEVDLEETTETATESEEDLLITPGQHLMDDISISGSQDPSDEVMLTITEETQGLKRKDIRRSSEEGNSDSVNDIFMSVGSFVNSFNPFGANVNETKKRNDKKKVRKDDDNVQDG